MQQLYKNNQMFIFFAWSLFLFFNYVSIISLFDVISIIGNTSTFIWELAILVAIGLVCYIVGSIKFEKKDLPL